MNKTTALLRLALLLTFALSCGIASRAQTIPSTKTKALDNSEVTLPPEGGRRPLILVVGFSRRGGQMCTPWSKRVAADFRNDSRVNYFQVPVLEGAPSFVRPMILRGMRKDRPAEDLPHTIPVYDHEAEWKKAASFSNTDNAYILVTDAQGRVVWQTQGALSDTSYGELRSAVDKLLAGGSFATSIGKP
jgi:hypothetical protein